MVDDEKPLPPIEADWLTRIAYLKALQQRNNPSNPPEIRQWGRNATEIGERFLLDGQDRALTVRDRLALIAHFDLKEFEKSNSFVLRQRNRGEER